MLFPEQEESVSAVSVKRHFSKETDNLILKYTILQN